MITGITVSDNGNLTISVTVTTNGATAASYQFSITVDGTPVWQGAAQYGIILNSIAVTPGTHSICAS